MSSVDRRMAGGSDAAPTSGASAEGAQTIQVGDRALILRALDPKRSVVVSACAGSGKTWLLVGRIFRLLLDGVSPSEILAVTFTRKAAQEMAARLDDLLQRAALSGDDELERLLHALGVAPGNPGERAAVHARARSLYEAVLTAEPRLTVSTFHSWFLQLAQRAPLAAGTAAGSTLTEESSALIEEALQRFGARAARIALREPEPGLNTRNAQNALRALNVPDRLPTLAEAIDRLFAECGLEQTLALLRSFIAHRAEWWAASRDEADPLQAAVARLRADLPQPLRDDPAFDPLLAARSDPAWQHDLVTYRELLTRNNKGKQEPERAARIEQAAQLADPARWYAQVRAALFTDGGRGTPLVYKPTDARRKRIGAEGEAKFLELHWKIASALNAVESQQRDRAAFEFNVAAFTCAIALRLEFDRVKRQRQALDFADLEQQACSLLTDDDHAAYLHARLDARYRHLLLDEFQDTNPLQWTAVRAWLDAAQAAGSTPIVFLVGDPKQSIYRFRGGEARLFDSAREFLVEHYAADVLMQDVSRRCAQPVIDLVNALFEGNAGFAGFRTHRAFDTGKPGRVELLPLARSRTAPGTDGWAEGGSEGGSEGVTQGGAEVQADAAAASGTLADAGPANAPVVDCRDPLTQARTEDEDLRVADEAAQLVAGLCALRQRCVLDDEGRARPVLWRDILVLVRSRGKLPVYERALRDASIPCISSRQGGLLDTLEVRDLLALLRFLVAPHDDLALAHALRSPVFSLSDPDLIAIATAADHLPEPRPGWHVRLNLLTLQAGASVEVRRAGALLARWFTLAGIRPVHDLLDSIYFDADVLARYRASVAPSTAPAVEANLLALIEHALATDAGRYPTLARFVDELADLAQAPAQEAPDEAVPGQAEDAVRVMTIHGAKGLEAPIVWVLNAAATSPAMRGNAVLIDWPADAPAPVHFSFWTRKDALGSTQSGVHQRAIELAEREDLNLLYVAVTRARQMLVVSGHALKGHDQSWHAQLRAALLRLNGTDEDSEDSGAALTHGAPLPVLDETCLQAAGPGRAPDQTGSEADGPDLDLDPRLNQQIVLGTLGGRIEPQQDGSDAGQRYGDAFHRLIEKMTEGPTVATGLSDATRVQLRDRLQVSAADLDRLIAQVLRVLHSPTLERFFDPRRYQRARNEVAFLDASGQLRRIDRLVEFGPQQPSGHGGEAGSEVWVLDYKTGDRDSIVPWFEAYREQLTGYAQAIRGLYPGRSVHAALVLGDGSLCRIDTGG